jgi:hypothetical protein
VILGSLYLATSTGAGNLAIAPTPSQLAVPASLPTTSAAPAVTAPPSASTASSPPLAVNSARPPTPSTRPRPVPTTVAPHSRAPAPPTAPRAVARLMVIMMENETYSSVIGNSSLPYLNGTLASRYPVLQQAFAIGHPSLPNYLEVLSGSTWGVNSDCSPGPGCQGAESLPNQLDQAGIGWAGYMESMPTAGYTGGDAGGDDGYGNSLYAQHHNPFVYFPSLAGELGSHVKPLTAMLPDLDSADPPAFAWVSPNMVDDMHDGPLTTGDTWLSQQIPAVQATKWYQGGGVILVLWDEGQDSDSSGIAGGSGGHVAGIVISQALAGTPADATPVDDAGILHSIEQTYGLAYLGDAAGPGHGSVSGL